MFVWHFCPIMCETQGISLSIKMQKRHFFEHLPSDYISLFKIFCAIGKIRLFVPQFGYKINVFESLIDGMTVFFIR